MKKTSPSIQFSPLIIGTMRLGVWGAKLNSKELERFIDECVELGLRDFDHADIYGHYTSEGEFGEVIKRRPDLKQKLQITTKCGIRLVCKERPGHTLNSYDSTKAHIIASAENSLKEIGLDHLDLLLLHRPGFLMDPAEIAEAFRSLSLSGKVRFFGVSNFSPSQFETLSAFTELVNNQIEISLLHLNPFTDGTLDQCFRTGAQPTAWSPLGGGLVFGKSEDARILSIQKTIADLSKKYQAPADQILLAFLLKHPAGIVPVLGTSKIARVKSALKAQHVNLSHEDWYALWKASTGKEVD